MGGKVFSCPRHGEYLETDKWAFRSRAWKQCNFAHVNLTTIHRQKDRKFIDILERCRLGKQLTAAESDLLLNHKSDVGNAVRLFSTREEVRRLNYQEYSKLKTQDRKYRCYDDIDVRQEHPHLQWKTNRLPDGSLAALKEQKFDTCVELKEGTRIVLQVNLNIAQGLVNGSQGIVIGWEAYDENRMPKADKSRVEGRGGASGRRGNEPPPMNAIMGEHAVYRETHVKKFIEQAQVKEWPIVEFDNGVRQTIFAECIVSELGDEEPYTLMSRTQIPLLAGWAMTVHKSQGMTLSKVEVDLGRAFEEGQMYVALSRARSLDGLKVRSLGRWNGGGNAEVMQFLYEHFKIGA
jgi:ATP-dependent DNA helicase PIF1